MSNSAFEQSVEVLRRNETDYQAKLAEAASLRQRLNDATVELEKVKVDLRRSEVRCDGLMRDVDRRQQAIDIFVKELTAKKQIVEQLTQENARLKRDLDAASRLTNEVQGTLKNRTAMNSQLSAEVEATAVLYMKRSFASGCDPNIDIMRCLFAQSFIKAVDPPVTYRQLGTLVDVLNMRDKLHSEASQAIESLEIAVDHQESFHQVVEIINALPKLRSVQLHGLGDAAASAIAAAIGVAENITELSLPALQVSDAGFAPLMSVIKNREILSIQKGTPVLIVRDLDLSQCTLADYGSLQAIHGQSLHHVNLSGCAILKDVQLGEMLRDCPALSSLSVARCPGLTTECLVAVNRAERLTVLDITGCRGVQAIRLLHVQTLHTDMSGVTFLECPKLASLPSPVTHFQCLSWVTPELTELTLHSVSLHTRELTLLADCASLTRVSFVNCRLQGLEVFIRKMRRLLSLAIHGCKGVLDADIMPVCSTLEQLDLTECFCITDKALIRIIDTCHQLKRLSIKRCANLTDAAILHLERLGSLEYLNVLGAKKVTVLALHKIVAALPSMKQVVHETLITASVQVDREDEEEIIRHHIADEERSLMLQREQLTVSPVSPVKPDGRPVSVSPRLLTPPGSKQSARPAAASPETTPEGAPASEKAEVMAAAM